MGTQLLTVKQAAARLACHEDTVRRLLLRGELRCVRLGRAVRIEEWELAAYVRRQRGDESVEPLLSGRQKSAINTLLSIMARDSGADRRDIHDRFLAPFGKTSTTELTVGEASDLIERLKAWTEGTPVPA
jgi:excisionase family DNA binding protein